MWPTEQFQFETHVLVAPYHDETEARSQTPSHNLVLGQLLVIFTQVQPVGLGSPILPGRSGHMDETLQLRSLCWEKWFDNQLLRTSQLGPSLRSATT